MVFLKLVLVAFKNVLLYYLISRKLICLKPDDRMHLTFFNQNLQKIRLKALELQYHLLAIGGRAYK